MTIVLNEGEQPEEPEVPEPWLKKWKNHIIICFFFVNFYFTLILWINIFELGFLIVMFIVAAIFLFSYFLFKEGAQRDRLEKAYLIDLTYSINMEVFEIILLIREFDPYSVEVLVVFILICIFIIWLISRWTEIPYKKIFYISLIVGSIALQWYLIRGLIITKNQPFYMTIFFIIITFLILVQYFFLKSMYLSKINRINRKGLEEAEREEKINETNIIWENAKTKYKRAIFVIWFIYILVLLILLILYS